MEEKKKKTKPFHRHFEVPGKPLYGILAVYLALGWFFPVIGIVAIICMIGPVLTSIWRGRYWCGHYCPRGNMFDRLLSKYSPHKPIPAFVRTSGFRLFMVLFIFTMFGIQLSQAHWSEGGLALWSDIGRVFWTIILVTTVVGVILGLHLCASYLVLLLSDGNNLTLGGTKEGVSVQSFHHCACQQRLPDEVQAMCPCVSYAAHTL